MEITELLKDPKFSISRTLSAKLRTNKIFSSVLGICAIYTDIRISMGVTYSEYFTPKSKVLSKGSHEQLRKAVASTEEALRANPEFERIRELIQHMVEKKWFNLLDSQIVIPDTDQIKDYKSFDYWINRYIRHITKTLTN